MLCASNNYIINKDIVKKISNFLYSDYYFLVLLALTTIVWGLGQVIPGPAIAIGISVMLLLIATVVVIQRDVLPVVPLIFFTMFCLASPNLPSYIWVVAIPAVIIVVAALFHFVYYKIEKFEFGKLFFPMVLFGIAILLGGIGSRLPANYKGNLMGALLIVIAPLFVYSIVLNYSNKDKPVIEYIAKTVMYFGLAMVVHLAVYYIFKPESLVILASVPHLGYGISNTIATYFLITFPMCFYLYTKKDGKIAYGYLVLAAIQVISIFLTTSRGATIFGIFEFIITIIVTFFTVDKRKRKEYIIITLILVLLCGLLFGALYKKIIGFIHYMFSDGMNDSGRFELYREALACFFEYPVFGVGLGYSGRMAAVFNSIGIYMFHNTILQYIACLGLVGLAAFAYLYFARLEIIFEEWNTYSLYIMMAFIGFEGYSLLNTGTVQGYPTAILIAILYEAHEIDTKQHESKAFVVVRTRMRERIKLLKKERIS